MVCKAVVCKRHEFGLLAGLGALFIDAGRWPVVVLYVQTCILNWRLTSCHQVHRLMYSAPSELVSVWSYRVALLARVLLNDVGAWNWPFPMSVECVGGVGWGCLNLETVLLISFYLLITPPRLLSPFQSGQLHMRETLSPIDPIVN